LIRKISSIFLCLMLLFSYIPTGFAEEGSAGTVAGSVYGDNADLSGLSVASSIYDCVLTPNFDSGTTEYTVNVSNGVSSVDVIATTADTSATLKINGATAASGVAQTVDNLSEGDNSVPVEVTAADGAAVKTYTITIKRTMAAVLPQTPEEYVSSDYAKYAARMAVGEAHIAVINANGTLVAGGDDTYKQCEVPEELSGVSVKAVAAGSYHTLALTENGRVFAWGQISHSGAYETVNIPTEVQELQGNIKLIAAGANMSAVLTNSNQLIVWGGSSYSSTLSAVPDGLGNIVAVAVNCYCVVTLDNEGNVTVWGDRRCGTEPDGLDGNVVAVAAGQWHWLALKKDGTVSVTGSSSMTRRCGEIANQTDVRAIVGGWQSASAILADGSIKCWGRSPAGTNTSGQVLDDAGTNIRAFTCTVSGGLGSSPALCAMQEDGAIKVLAPSAFTTDPITDTFNFLTIPGNNADLSGLEVTGYALSPSFAGSTDTYTVNVPTDVSNVDIIATTADSAATLKINGESATSGTARTVSDLAEGDNSIPVVVTAADLTTVKTYTLTITRAGEAQDSNNANLNGLAVTGYDLDPAFDADTTEYDVNIPNEVSSVDITATTDDSNATFKINETAATSGTAVTVDNLAVGENQITLEVTAEDQSTVKTYTLTVIRAESSGGSGGSSQSSADLNGLAVTGYDLDPAFDAATTEYDVNIPNEVSSVEITATTADSSATLQINGSAAESGAAVTVDSLAVGENQIAVEVTAEDQNTVKTYTLTVIRDGDASDSSLSALTVAGVAYEGAEASACGIYPEFDSDQTEGIVDVANTVTEVRITAQTSSSSATLAINGAPAEAGVATVVYGSGLAEGDNLIPINVTAANGSQSSYTLHVKKVSADYRLPALSQTPADYQESEYTSYACRLSAGQSHVLALKNDGTVAAWGENGKNQCDVPNDLNQVVAVAAGSYHSLALLADGTVAAWGLADNGQCDVPDDLQNAVDIAAGYNFSAVLDQNGEVYVWGDNSYSQCEVPDDLSGVVDIQCGLRHILALKADGTIVACGNNSFGQCDVPDGLDHVVAIAAGFHNSAALKDDGTMVIWGAEGSKYEIKNLGLQYVKAISISGKYIATLKWDGSVAVWYNYSGRNLDLGVPLALDEKILAISGPLGSSECLLTLNEDGTVSAWGTGTSGQCDIPSGLNLFEDDIPYSGPSPDIPQTPAAYADSVYARAAARVGWTHNGCVVLNMDGTVKVAVVADNDKYNLEGVPEDLSNVKAIASTNFDIMALKEDGTVVVWGYNGDGQCDADLSDVTAIATGNVYSPYCLALKEDGTVVAWGDNTDGQCDVPADLSDVTAIAAGNDNCLALKSDGTVAVWGNDEYCAQVPADLSNVARIYPNVALKEDGTVVTWGIDAPPAGLSGVVDIAEDNGTYVALKNNGTVVVWGNNVYGRRNVPAGLHDVAAIAATNGVMAIKTDGTVVNWGYSPGCGDLLTGLSKVLTMKYTNGSTVIFRDGTLGQYSVNSTANDEINAMLDGLNVLSGHYFNIASVDLLNSSYQSISSVGGQGGYRIEA